MAQEEKGKRRKFFSWRKETPQQEEEAAPANPEAEKQADQGVQEGQAAPPPEVKTALAYSTVSGLLQLWALWRTVDGGAPVPELDLAPEGAGSLPLQENSFEREIRRLSTILSECSDQRMKKLQQMDGAPDGAEADLDVEYVIQLSDDQMVAWGLAFPPSGNGRPLNREDLEKVLKDRGITSGIREEALDAFVKAPYFKLHVLAVGTPPADGTDGYIIERIPRQPEWKGDGEGDVDYRAQSNIIGIAAGDVICDVVPPQDGINGVRVNGQPLMPRKGKEAKPPMGSNTTYSEDKTQVVATMDGHVLYSGGLFHVKPALEVAGDVDYSTGNINFRGDVHISGDVRVNFEVRATGNITIDGLVEAATVEADGDVIIAKGVLGEHKAVIRSGKSVRARYLENCTVYSGDCTYSDCIISCEVFSDKRISVLSGRGAIIGGHLTAAEQVEAVTIGTQSERKTEIELGLLPFVQKALEENRQAVKDVQAELKELEKQAAAAPGMESKWKLRKSVLALKESKLLKAMQELEEKKPNLAVCVLSGGTVYPGTELTVGRAKYYFETVQKSCKAYYNEKELSIEIL